MAQNYLVIKNSDHITLRNKHYKECIEKVQVQIVITTMRKYARIDYDFDTLNNADQIIRDLSACHISEKIRAYALQYAKEKKLPSARTATVIGDVAGGFEFFIDDVEKVGTEISHILGSVVKGNCIRYETKEEMIAKMSPEELEAMKAALGEEYFK